MDSARHVITRISNPRFLSRMVSYDVASTLMDRARHVITRSSNPRFLSRMVSHDVASIIH
jgi:hypothetical protein